MRQFTRALHRLIPALLVLAFLVGVPPSPRQVVAAASIELESSAASPSFPDEVVFSLTARSADPIARVELLYAPADQQTLNLVTPDFRPGERIEASHRLDLALNYLPPGIDISYRWRVTTETGQTAETDTETFVWLDDRFEWDKVATDQVEVYTYTGDRDFAETILDSAQRTIDRLQTDFGVERLAPIRIWAYNSKRDFQGAQAPNSEPWIAGTAYPDLRLVLAVLPEGDEREVGRVVPHEISHQVLSQAARNPFNAPPTWLDEGLAVLNQTNGDEDFPALVQNASDQGRLFSVRALNAQFPYDPADASLAYAQSRSIVSFIIDTYGSSALADLIAVYREGVPHDEAARRALGIDLTELDRLWKESLGYEGDQGPAGGVRRTPDSPTGDLGNWLASGALIMAAVAVVAVVVGFSALRRSARRDDGDDEDIEDETSEPAGRWSGPTADFL